MGDRTAEPKRALILMPRLREGEEREIKEVTDRQRERGGRGEGDMENDRWREMVVYCLSFLLRV